MKLVKPARISERLWWVGAVDAGLKVFDIEMEAHGTSYNAFLVIGSAKNALIETVKEEFFNEMLLKVKSVLDTLPRDRRKIDYIIHNHTEPDHSGSSSRVVQEFPKAVVVGSKNALTYLEDIWSSVDAKNVQKLIAAEEVEKIDLGGIVLELFNAPFLHWPDSIFTYCEELSAIFTCDVFGTHFPPKSESEIFLSDIDENQILEFEKQQKYYFDCIFHPFKDYVRKGLDVIQGNVFDKNRCLKWICTSHGPIISTLESVQKTIEKYTVWSALEKKDDIVRINIVYVSSYGYTREIAESIKRGIEKEVGEGSVVVKLYDLQKIKSDHGKLSSISRNCDGLLIGSPTINSDAVPTLYSYVVKYLNPIANKGLVSAVFGSYGWSGEGVDHVDQRLVQLRFKLPLDPLKIRFRPSEEDDQTCRDFGSSFVKAVRAVKRSSDDPEEIQKLFVRKKKREGSGGFLISKSAALSYPNDGKVRKWRCIVCGEVFIGTIPPTLCPACSAEGPEIWVCEGTVLDVREESEGEIIDEWKGTIIIVGGGAAGVSCADEMRRNNKSCRIVFFSDDGLPHYRTSISNEWLSPEKNKVEYFHSLEYYKTHNIELVLKKIVEVGEESEKKGTYFVVDEVGKKYECEKLVLCTGSSPLKRFKEAEYVWSVYELQQLQEKMTKLEKKDQPPPKVVVIGTGLLGIEMIQIVKKMNPSSEIVVVEEKASRIMSRQLDPQASALLSKEIEDQGNTTLIYEKKVLEVTSTTKKDSVIVSLRLDDGEKTTILCDLVIDCVQQKVETQLGKSLGLETHPHAGWIKVNPFMETSKKGVFAAGDIAQLSFLPFVIPNWRSAVNKGQCVARNILSMDEKYRMEKTPFVIHCFELEIYSLGNVNGKNVIMSSDAANQKYCKFCFDGEKGNVISGILVLDKKGKIPSVGMAELFKRKVKRDEFLFY